MIKVCLAEETGELYPQCHFDTQLCTKGYFITPAELEQVAIEAFVAGINSTVDKTIFFDYWQQKKKEQE
jgi:hypothetical protein